MQQSVQVASCAAGEEASKQCSLAYAAPEVLRSYAARKPIAADPAVDIWALGVVAYEALTDSVVFPPSARASRDACAAAHSSAPYPWESGRRDKQLSQCNLCEVVVACLARDPSARPSARELLAHIDRLNNAATGTFELTQAATLNMAETNSARAATPTPEHEL